MTPRLQRVGAEPVGDPLAQGDGDTAGFSYTLTLTLQQLHFRLHGGASYAVNLRTLAQSALDAIVADLAKRERDALKMMDNTP